MQTKSGPAIKSVKLRVAVLTAALALLALPVKSEPAFDESARLKLLEVQDGLLEHVKSKYNDIYIHKKRDEVTMSFHIKGWHYTESRTNLRDPDELPLMYSRTMTVSVIYPEQLKRILMIGIGGGSITTYFARFLPDAHIDAVDIDPSVIELAKKYFGIRQTEKVRYYADDGRAFIENAKQPYDLIMLDAYDGGSVPSHLMTTEFYELVKSRLTPGGAVVSNVHDGTKLYASTLLTMTKIFGPLDLYLSGRGETMVIGTNRPMPDAAVLKKHADELQQKVQFRYSPAFLLSQKDAKPPNTKGEILTDKSVPKQREEEEEKAK